MRLALVAMPLFLLSGQAFAGVGTLPGHNLDRVGDATVGAPGGTPATESFVKDENGDGLIQRSEIKPGSQLDRRFETRDKNRDGVLSPDEYYLPKGG